jgi:hypothetical protein
MPAALDMLPLKTDDAGQQPGKRHPSEHDQRLQQIKRITEHRSALSPFKRRTNGRNK